MCDVIKITECYVCTEPVMPISPGHAVRVQAQDFERDSDGQKFRLYCHWRCRFGPTNQNFLMDKLAQH